MIDQSHKGVADGKIIRFLIKVQTEATDKVLMDGDQVVRALHENIGAVSGGGTSLLDCSLHRDCCSCSR